MENIKAQSLNGWMYGISDELRIDPLNKGACLNEKYHDEDDGLRKREAEVLPDCLMPLHVACSLALTRQINDSRRTGSATILPSSRPSPTIPQHP
jgi:hypothetical protein